MSTSRNSQPSGLIKGTDFEDQDVQGFLNEVHKLIVDEALVNGTNRETKVIDFRHPADLKDLLQLEVTDSPASHESLIQACKNVIQFSVKTGHPRFFNQLYSGLNAYGLAGSWVTDALNTNIHTYEVSPAFILIEQYLMQKICGVIGYQHGDGLFCPGGSFSNIMAMNLARFRVAPDFKTHGMYGLKRMKFYTSEEAHYSLVKGAVFLGLGSDSVVKVETDERGKIKPECLEAKIQEDIEKGELPTFVMATSGTTVLGAYDDLGQLADICDRHNVWLHCDACWGGGALFSAKHRPLMTNAERTHSVAWNFHKMTAAPLQSSALLIKEKGLLEECNRFKAEYLFQPDKCYDTSYDIGDKTVQCGRKVDSLKLWLLWKALGDSGFAAITDNCFDNAKYLAEQMKQTDGFRLCIPEFECANVCFWYIPPSLRGQEETPEWWQKLSKVAPAIKERMMQQGTMMIGYNPLTCKGFVNFFRIIVGNSKCDHSDMDFVIAEIVRLGKDL